MRLTVFSDYTLRVLMYLALDRTRLATIPEIHYYLASSGQGGGGGFGVGGGNVRFGRVQIVLHDLKERHRSNSQIADEITAMTKDIPVATIRVSTSGGGGGSGQPVQALITGEDPRVLQAIGQRVQETVAAIPGALPLAIRGCAPGKPKPLLITQSFPRAVRRSIATDAVSSEASVVKTKRAASAISDGWISGLATPEICDQNTLRMGGNSARARHSNMRGWFQNSNCTISDARASAATCARLSATTTFAPFCSIKSA